MNRQKLILALALIAAVFVFTSCKNPLLSVGLGDKVDILPPGITIVPLDGVQNGAYLHGAVTVYGEMTDDVGVESVTWMFADDATATVSPVGTASLDAAGATWSFVLDTTQPGALWADGEKSFTITVSDGSGKSTETRMLLIFDNTAPTGTFINPANGASVYNQVMVRGANSDNTSLIKVQVRIGNTTSSDADTDFVDIVGSKYDWTRSFLSNDFANSNSATDNGDGTWTLPIYLRIYDYAGNVSTNEPSTAGGDSPYPTDLVTLYGVTAVDFTRIPAYALIIDLDRDKPTASIQTPRDATNIAGTVVASGTCFDENPGMKKVQIRIMALEDSGVPPADEIGYVTSIGGPAPGEGWEDTTLSGGAYWSINLNENEELYNVTDEVGDAYYGSGKVHNGKLRIEIRPVDLNDKIGSTQAITFRLDQSIPRLSDTHIVVNGVPYDAWDYLYVRGNIALTATASDDQSVESIKLSLDGGSTYGIASIGAVPGISIPINYAIDTLTDPQIPLAIRTAKSGLLGMVVKITDNATPAPYVNTWFVTLNLDNLYPTGSYTGTVLNGHNPMDLHGNIGDGTSQVMGTSADGGTVGGIDRVEVYLVKGTSVIDLRNGSLVPKESALFGELQTSEDYTTDPYCRFDIDWTKVGALDHMQLTQNGSNIDWWAQIDTDANGLPDGDVEINHVVWDKAGNAVHGMQPGFIRNNVPSIDSITVGTDVNGDGTIGNVASGESRLLLSGYATSNFTVRNNRLRITVAASSGNGTLRYSLKYAGTIELNTTPFTGTSVTVTDFSGMPDGATNDSTFDILVYDSTMSDDPSPVGELSAGATLGLTLDNADTSDPTVYVAPFGKRYSTGASDVSRVLQTVGSYAENVVTSSGIPLGHVEYQAQSLYDGLDADVSGSVIIRGKAYDNQQIGRITVEIPNYNPPDPDGAGPLADPGGPGTEFDVAAFSGGVLTSHYTGTLNSVNTWALDLESASLTEQYGDVANWALRWNSAAIANYAQDDLAITVRVYDRASPENTASAPLAVDVVPYLTAVTTTQTALGGIKENNIRSSLGRYSIKTGATANFITIEGFNLNPIANGVRISSATSPSGLNGTTLVGNSLAVNSVNADRTVLTVSNATAASGFLSVVSGTALAPVPSVNNVNENDSYLDLNGDLMAQLSEQYNREPDTLYIKNLLLSDDRYVDFYTVTDTGFTSSYFPNMLMDVASPDTPYWGYVQGAAANDLQVRRGLNSGSNIGMIRILAADQLAMARDDDNVYHLVTVNNFNNGRMVYLYNMYETTPGYANGGATSPYWSGYTGVLANTAANNAIELDSVNYGSLALGRYTNIQMVVKGRSNTAGQYSRVYLGFYDQNTGELLFRNHRVGLAGGAQTLYDTGRSNLADIAVTSGDTTRKLVSNAASQYFALGVTDQNRVVFVYYDQAVGRLKLTYSTAAIDLAAPTDAVTFSAPLDIPVDYFGWYVSMAIESDGNAGTADPIHVAAYDTSDGDLRYVYFSSYADTGPQVVRVDANNSVGIYSSIKVQAGKPWIAYYNNSENGTRDSIKFARYLGSMAAITDGASVEGYATGDWEYATVPVNTPPQGGLTKFLKVNLDFNTTGDLIAGYAANSLEYSRRLPEVTP